MRSLLLGVFAAISVSANAGLEYAPGLVSVKIKPGQATAAHTYYKTIGATLTRSVPQIGWETIRLKSSMTVQTALSKLKSSKAFSVYEGNLVRHPLELPNDPMVPLQYSLTKMQLSPAWAITKANSSAVVAILDTGVDINHPDLAGACLPGTDTADGDSNPIGTNPHGTHCAGIAAAIGNNGIGVAGIAYGASILPVKVFPDNIDGASAEALSAGIIWAADHGANVISMSLGGGGLSQMEADAMDYAYSKNVVLVAAAGNENTSAQSYPAAYPICIAVGATDSDDQRAVFSNFGADWVDVAAPGVLIRSTMPNNQYMDESGTSMACPNVAGLATLIISRAGVGTLTNDNVRAIIEDNCDPVGSWVAKGRVNAYQSILHTGSEVLDEAVSIAPTPLEGTISGVGTSIDSTDGISMLLRAIRKPAVGLTGAMSADYELTKLSTDELTSGTISFSVKADKVATIQVFLWDDLNGKWVIVGTQPGSGSFKAASFPLTKTTVLRYMNNGKLRLLVRSLIPPRLAGNLVGITYIDKATVTYKGVKFFTPTP